MVIKILQYGIFTLEHTWVEFFKIRAIALGACSPPASPKKSKMAIREWRPLLDNICRCNFFLWLIKFWQNQYLSRGGICYQNYYGHKHTFSIWHKIIYSQITSHHISGRQVYNWLDCNNCVDQFAFSTIQIWLEMTSILEYSIQC